VHPHSDAVEASGAHPKTRSLLMPTDNKLRKVFGKDKVTMFEMNKHLAQHLR
jgi:chromatin remodeling complex protein RSC6